MRHAPYLSTLAIGARLVAFAGPQFHVIATTAIHPSLLRFDEETWSGARHVRFGPPEHFTEFRALWNEKGLYVRFDAKDRNPWWTYTQRDDPLWEEEVVEIFVDPSRTGDQYAELEINPANVVCDLWIVSGKLGKNADRSWNLEGLQSKTRTEHGPDGEIDGWTAVLFLPWEGLGSLPPRPGETWRFNVFRIERPGGEADPETDVILSAWSPPPGRSFHVPDVFRDLVFVED